MVPQPPPQADAQREQALITQYIDTDPWGAGRDEARLRQYGTPVWALVAYMKVAQNDLKRVAEEYGLPLEAVEAAMGYYRQNRALIDARVLLNEA
jgi:uncharacterized protein (DUF433 family)